MALVVLAALFAPVIQIYPPNDPNMPDRNTGPSDQHLLGTDGMGRDVWARIVHGGRASLLVAVFGVGIYLVIATVLGCVSGYYGRAVDFAIQRFTDTMMAFPTILLIITFVAFTKPGIVNVFLAIGLMNWPGPQRLLRAQVLSLREREFVQAARCLGASDLRILARHILPSLVPILLVLATFGVADAILMETSLSFLGLGVPPPSPTWGGMIQYAVSITVMEQMPWLWIFPGFAIVVSVLSVNFIGDGLTAALDPHQLR